MRLRRRAGSDHHIDDRNNGDRHEHAFVDARARLRPAARGRAAAALLRRRLVVRQVPPARRRPSCVDSLPVITKALLRRKVTPARRCSATSSPRPTSRTSSAIFDTVEGRDERYELNLYITGYDEDDEAGADDRAATGAATARQTGAEAGQPGQSPEESPTR